MRLKDQVAIVTGGAKGIGAGICKLFCQEGAKVIIWDPLDQGQETANNLSDQGSTIVFRKTDITDREDIKLATRDVIQRFGRIDILINNAGIIRDRTLLNMTDEDWDMVLNVNLTGAFNTTKAVLPFMKEQGYGRIVSASSINGILGAFGQTNYAASKAGIIGFTKALSKEVGKYGITANVIAPGFIKTDMTDSIPEQFLNEAIIQIPVQRLGTTEDMAHAYLFLASKESGFINGHVLNANGGQF